MFFFPHPLNNLANSQTNPAVPQVNRTFAQVNTLSYLATKALLGLVGAAAYGGFYCVPLSCTVISTFGHSG